MTDENGDVLMGTLPQPGQTIRIWPGTKTKFGCIDFQAAWREGQREFTVASINARGAPIFEGKFGPRLNPERYTNGDIQWEVIDSPAKLATAASILEAGLGHMQDRAATYDKPDGERSMKATVDAFYHVTGISMSEEQGWLFMTLLKAVRSQQGDFKLDNYEDGAAYFGLTGEAARRYRGDG